jgi:hypothetical protein
MSFANIGPGDRSHERRPGDAARTGRNALGKVHGASNHVVTSEGGAGLSRCIGCTGTAGPHACPRLGKRAVHEPPHPKDVRDGGSWTRRVGP